MDTSETVFEVTYTISGTTHGGWCSGAEADDESDCFTKNDIKLFVVSSSKKHLNFKLSGCLSTTGSGYCNGYRRKFTQENSKVVNIEIPSEDDESVIIRKLRNKYLTCIWHSTKTKGYLFGFDS